MSVYVGDDGYGRFVIGWVYDEGGATKATPLAAISRAQAWMLYDRLGRLLGERDLREELREKTDEVESLKRSNAALRGALRRRRRR